MHIVIKIIVSVAIILTATALGRKFPAAAGLIAVMPLTGVLVLVWTYVENRGDAVVMQGFAKGALWGLLPSVLFFLTAFVCVKKNLHLPYILAASFAVWLGAAAIHQWLLK
jgi:uncharacterized membrane protein (GlpM family)